MKDWCVITGASSGIGFELARLFALDGWNIAMAARDPHRLSNAAAEIKAAHQVEVRELQVDLSSSEAADHVYSAMKDVEVSALINNAGFGKYGKFAEVSLKESGDIVRVNILALVELTGLFIKPMLQRRRGMILNVGSVAAFQPGPTMNVYYASKAFVYSFSYAVAAELQGTGVTMTVLNPGTTRTGFFDRAGVHISRPYPVMDAGKVALAGYRAMLKGKRSVTPGLMNRLASCISPCLPSRFTAAAVRRIHQR